jgi:outer membrane protein TolC
MGLAGAVTAPIFEGGALEAPRRGAEKAFDAALANYEQTVLQSFSQVADVLHTLKHDADLVRDGRRALGTAGACSTSSARRSASAT